jgi:DMSO/TMAO reductase YedYZ heme-binding membrane subunit
MNEKTWWYLSRSSGIVALVLLVLSIVWGVLLSTRVLKPYDRPAWLLDLHRWLGGTALAMTVLHLLGLMLDGYINFGFADILIPGASSYRPLAVAIGVVSFYILVAIQVTSYFRKRLSKQLWHGVHVLSYGLVWGAALHAGLAGTDVKNRAYQVLAVALTVGAIVATIVRVVSLRRPLPVAGGELGADASEPSADVLA